MINIDKINSGGSYRFILSPNCSINWRQLLIFYVFTCFVALSVSLFFILQGIWMVLPFSGVEMLVLGVALHFVFRRTHNREVIFIDNASVRIEKGMHSPDCYWEFEKSYLRLHDEITNDFEPRRKLELGSHGKYVEVGDFLSNFEKDELVFRLKDCIIPA